MKQLIIALALAALAGASLARSTHPAASPASAADGGEVAAATPGTPQRSKMKACNADAKSKSLHGDERRAFMKQCLSGKGKAAAAT